MLAGGTATTGDTVDDASFATFYNELSPYGDWIDAPVCGRRFGRVWRPSPRVAGPDFMPYETGGHWVPSDQGWVFQSDFDWGWATFHYGRWCDDQRFGWVWVPGDQWAPAWVEWRHGGGYVGWAPLPPAGVGLSGSFWIYSDEPTFASGRVTRYGLPRERVYEAQRVTRPIDRSVTHQTYAWPARPPVNVMRGPDGGPVRPVHVAPPARGSVGPVIIRRHPD